MITLLGRDNCRPVYIPEDLITKMEEKIERTQERDYPFTRIHIQDLKQGHAYFVDVVESKRAIQKIIDSKKKEEPKNGKAKRKSSTETDESDNI